MPGFIQIGNFWVSLNKFSQNYGRQISLFRVHKIVISQTRLRTNFNIYKWLNNSFHAILPCLIFVIFLLGLSDSLDNFRVVSDSVFIVFGAPSSFISIRFPHTKALKGSWYKIEMYFLNIIKRNNNPGTNKL